MVLHAGSTWIANPHWLLESESERASTRTLYAQLVGFLCRRAALVRSTRNYSRGEVDQVDCDVAEAAVAADLLAA